MDTYEKKYKEALEIAKGIHSFSSDIAEIKRMEQIFPELKESAGDEKKELSRLAPTPIELEVDYGFDAELNALLKKCQLPTPKGGGLATDA